MRRLTAYALTTMLAVGTAVGSAAAAQAAAFPVNPGPVVAGRTIIGSGQNLPPLVDQTYDVGSYMAPQVKAYYTGKAIQQDRADVSLAAWRYVRDWTRKNCGATPAEVKACKAAVVFDVDETLLGSYSYSLTTDPQFTFDPTTWTEYINSCGYAGIPQTRDLFNRFIKLGVHVALLSADSENTRKAMVRCLHEKGIAGWDNYILKGQDDDLSDAKYKARARKGLEKSGLTIVASIGDQVSDMSYGHLRRGFLLPNTMYYTS